MIPEYLLNAIGQLPLIAGDISHVWSDAYRWEVTFTFTFKKKYKAEEYAFDEQYMTQSA